MSLQVLLTSDQKLSFAQVFFKAALLVSAVSLLAYIPFKYVTQLHAIKGLYAFMLPLSSVVALAGIALALFPKRVLQLPFFVRAGIGSIATIWMITGLLCIPVLVGQSLIAPASGLFATFQMFAQHVFLSLSVVALVLAPHVNRGWFNERFFLALKRSA
jgi:hypothetical protein